MIRRAAPWLASALAVALAALCWGYERHGLRCTYFLARPDPAGRPAGRGWEHGLLRAEHVGPRFSSLRRLGVSAQVFERFAAAELHQGSVRWTGHVFVPSPGVWSFGTRSDDDSAVMLDDRLVACNWGAHLPRTHWGRALVAAGWHRLRVDYVNREGDGLVDLVWKGPGGPVAAVPAEFLARDLGPEPWLARAWGELVPPGGATGGAGWRWADLWGGPGPDAALAGGTADPSLPGRAPAPEPAGTWRVWRARFELASTRRVQLSVAHAARCVVWLGGVPVVGSPARPEAGGRTFVRTLPAGVSDVLVATEPGAPCPPLTAASLPVDGPGYGPLEPRAPARDPWPASPLDSPGFAPLCEEVAERLWYWTETRLQAPYIYRWSAREQGHPSQIAPLAARWTGELEVPVTGAWTLTVRSSGRAWLSIAGQTLYKDAAAPEASACLTLAAGRHPIALDAHDPGVVRTLALWWTPPGGEERLVEPAALWPGGDGAAWFGLAALALAAAWVGALALCGGPRRWLAFLWRRRGAHAWGLLVLLGLAVRLHDYAYVPNAGDTDDELSYHMIGTALWEGAPPIGWTWFTGFPLAQTVPLHGRVFRMVAPMVAYPPLYSLLIGAVNVAAGATSSFDVRLHVTRLVPIALSTLALALVLPVARALRMRPSAGLLATAFLAVFPSAVMHARLVKEENLLAPLFLAALWLVLRADGPRRRWLLAAVIVAAILTKPTGAAIAVFAVTGLAWRGRWRAAVHAALAAVLGVALFAWYGFACGGVAWLWQMRTFAGYAARLDVLTPLVAHNTLTGFEVPGGWLAGLWIAAAASTLGLKPGARRFLGLALASGALVTLATYPAQLNWGWYKIPLWPLFALAWGQQAARLLRRAEPLAAILFVGLFLLPTLHALGSPPVAWVEVRHVTPLVGFLKLETPAGPANVRALLRATLALLVGPAFVAGALPRPARRAAAALTGTAILAAALAAMLVLDWHWGLVYPMPMPGDPYAHYENGP